MSHKGTGKYLSPKKYLGMPILRIIFLIPFSCPNPSFEFIRSKTNLLKIRVLPLSCEHTK